MNPQPSPSGESLVADPLPAWHLLPCRRPFSYLCEGFRMARLLKIGIGMLIAILLASGKRSGGLRKLSRIGVPRQNSR